MSETITGLTLEALRDAFQNVGYRVETLTDPVAGTSYLRSATAGLGFEIRPGNSLVGDDQNFVDVMLVSTLQVQGELPLDLVNRWNATRRFGRLQLSPPFLAFCLDVSVAGGVAPNYLRAQIEIWDRLVQELIGYLREELPKVAAANNAAAAAAQAGSAAQQPALERTAEQGAGATIQ
ncbi:YbjN domain-containing protein [Bradyrhizobium sp. WSM 1704]|uniref:YbjN domain-containing protein n=1 Tax=Bradyrhizobium semiaridum TaxID=2821404 RepID=UPI001CE2AB15|nr:YbjN domain-containing protein [Bradyrhizobium semiaridum]MCA6124966.1 YbjN domain-containing protein [Bradyrhizobium semiaridum]